MAIAGAANHSAGDPTWRARRRRAGRAAAVPISSVRACVVSTRSLLLVRLVELVEQPADVRLAGDEVLDPGEVGRLDLRVRPLLIHEGHGLVSRHERGEGL